MMIGATIAPEAFVISHLHRLMEHLRWADERALRALRVAQPAHPNTARARELFAHVLGAENVWLARMQGRTSDVAVWPSLALDECEGLAATVHAELHALVAGLDEAGAARVVRYRNSAGVAFESRIEDILMQIALHGAYHRGQVMLMLREAGDEPIPTDFIAFVRGAPPARRTS